MRRMVEIESILKKPSLFHEAEITNDSSLNVKLEPGAYLIVLHADYNSNIALLNVNEDNINISTATMFNAGAVGASIGYYQYDTLGQLLEVYDGSENNVTVNGHIDIYKF